MYYIVATVENTPPQRLCFSDKTLAHTVFGIMVNAAKKIDVQDTVKWSVLLYEKKAGKRESLRYVESAAFNIANGVKQ